MDCIFCKIAKGEVPSAKVYEDNEALAFLDISPAPKEGGHILVIPKQHYETIDEMPVKLLEKTIAVVQKVSKAVKQNAEGFNVLQSNGKAAGQSVPHTHFHVIPRKEGDGLHLAHWHGNAYEEGKMEEARKRIKRLIDRQA